LVFLSSQFGAAFAGSSRPPRQSGDDEWRTTNTVSGGRAQPSTIEMRLVGLVYERTAAELSCEQCGARLGREVRFMSPSDPYPPSWRMLAVTRCSGWRTHRHFADITESAEDLLLGPFHLS
jgi:hypothetical protein